MGIADKVKFLLKSNHVYEILCYSDLFLLPSASESFGLAALEAMMMRVPVISSNVGGLPEVNIEGQSGYLFDLGDPHKMAKQAISLMKDEVLLEKMKDQASAVAKCFDIDTVVNQYIEVYKKALKS